MSLIQFLRILWARRYIVAAAAISCVVGAILVIIVLPPRFEAHSRVLMNLLKPDPVTGQVIAGPATRTYVATQRELIQDEAVAGQVADQLGLLSDPYFISQFSKTSAARTADDSERGRLFRRWVAQWVIERTDAKIVEGSNILEITFTSPTAEQARNVADAIRKAYIDTTLSFRRADAARSADWWSAQAEKARVQLDSAEQAKTAFEKENGVVLQAGGSDIDSARLSALAGQAGTVMPAFAPVVRTTSPAAIQLAQIDAQIAQLSQTLGPNHPELVQLRAQRASISQLVAQDEAAQRSAASAAAGAASAGVGALDRAVSVQKARVIAQRDKIDKLSQLQAEVDLRRDQFSKTSARAAELRQEAAAADTGLTPLGGAVAPSSPKFPNKPLILLGSLGLGLALGVLVALLAELLGRRVRGVEDLEAAVGVPLLAVVAAEPMQRAQRRSKILRALPRAWWVRRRIA